jgi:glycine dehydrogenase subunit 1
MGKEGLKKVAELCFSKSHYAYDKLIGTGKFSPVFTAPFFKEFAVQSSEEISTLNDRLLEKGFIGGYDMGNKYPECKNVWLVAVTEKRTKQEIDDFARKAGE